MPLSIARVHQRRDPTSRVGSAYVHRVGLEGLHDGIAIIQQLLRWPKVRFFHGTERVQDSRPYGAHFSD